MAQGTPDRHPWPGPRPFVVGHRGAPRRAPPNTLEAIAAAVDLGADAVEIDVRATADGEPVLLHDATLDGARVDELSFPEAEEHARREGAELATLEAALAQLDGHPLDVEIKDPAATEAILETLTEHRGTEAVLVTSFHIDALETAARVTPRLPRGLLLSPARALRLLYRRHRARRLDALATRAEADALIPHRSFARLRLLSTVSACERPVFLWTINRDRRLRRHLAHPLVSGVITDRTARAVHLREVQHGPQRPDPRTVDPGTPAPA